MAGGVLLIGFLLVEHRVSNPMLPLEIFRSRQFSGANAATLANYFAIGAMFFFLSLQLQDVLGYSAVAAGAASLPPTVIMLLFSPQAGRLGQRIGARTPMRSDRSSLVSAWSCSPESARETLPRRQFSPEWSSSEWG